MVKRIYGIFQQYVVRGEEDRTKGDKQLMWCVTSKKKAELEVKRLYEKFPDRGDSFLTYKYFYKPLELY